MNRMDCAGLYLLLFQVRVKRKKRTEEEEEEEEGPNLPAHRHFCQ